MYRGRRKGNEMGIPRMVKGRFREQEEWKKKRNVKKSRGLMTPW